MKKWKFIHWMLCILLAAITLAVFGKPIAGLIVFVIALPAIPALALLGTFLLLPVGTWLGFRRRRT
jgi:hypothetical protein